MHVELIDHMGDDLTVVNAARVSFGKKKTQFDHGDLKLIKFLAREDHWSPFGHASMQFHIKGSHLCCKTTSETPSRFGVERNIQTIR